ncbi:MAG: NACHT domain-containing protein [Myxococcota bacterium]
MKADGQRASTPGLRPSFPPAWLGEDEGRASFVGRSDELERTLALLREGRVTTVVGPAGIGKSRLAREVARSWDEAYVLPLSQLNDGDGCVARVARALRLDATSDESDVGRSLAARGSVLLVLDDADRVVQPLAALINAWAARAPELRVLVTSRERLRMRRETTVELGSLSCEGGASSDAAKLLLSAVERVSGGITLEDAEVVRWCEWLDGVPLALELAAARAPFLGEAGEGDRIAMLDRGFRDAQPRHSTLAQAIAWSWEQLDEGAQRCLAEAAAFVGTFDVRVASQVIEGGGSPAQETLRALVDKSLLRIDGRQRLRLDGAVREFVIEALPDAHQQAQQRLDRALAARAAGSPDEGLASIPFHPDDVLASAERMLAADCVLEPDERAWALVLAARLLQAEGPVQRLSSLMASGIEALSAAKLDPALLLRLKLAHAVATRMQGQHPSALEALMELVLEAGGHVPALRALVYTEAAIARHAQRDLDGARALYEQSLELTDSPRLSGRLCANLGSIAHDAGDLDAAEQTYKQALTSLTPLGDGRLLGAVHCNLGLLYQERGDLVLAEQTMRLGLGELDGSEDRYLGGIHRGNYGQLLLEMGRVHDAMREQELAYASLSRMGDDRSAAISLSRLGAARALRGDFAGAERDFDEARGRAQRTQDTLAETVVNVYCAFLPLGRAEKLGRGGDGHEAHVDRCRSMLASAIELPGWRYSDDARTGRRILEARLGAQTRVGAESEDGDLFVCIESRFFRLKDQPWQDLQGSTPARRILESLIERREGLDIKALQEHVWPGERIDAEAAKNRIYVALSHLRKRGLKPYIVRTGTQYALEAELRVRRIASVAPPDEPRGP